MSYSKHHERGRTFPEIDGAQSRRFDACVVATGEQLNIVEPITHLGKIRDEVPPGKQELSGGDVAQLLFPAPRPAAPVLARFGKTGKQRMPGLVQDREPLPSNAIGRANADNELILVSSEDPIPWLLALLDARDAAHGGEEFDVYGRPDFCFVE